MAAPLTTIFSPPPACATLQPTVVPGPNGDYIDQDFDIFAWLYKTYSGDESQLAASAICYPSGLVSGSAIFSPGLACPTGFSSYSATSDLSDAVTTRYCCPSNFVYQTAGKFACYSGGGSPITATSSIVVVDNSTFASELYTPETITSPRVYYPAITLLFKENELSLLVTSTSSSSSSSSRASSSNLLSTSQTQSSIASTASSTVSSSSSETKTVSSSSTLSTGAKAGIGIGCAGLAIFLIGAIFLCLRYRRQNGANPGDKSAELDARSHDNLTAIEKGSDSQRYTEIMTTDPDGSHELKGSLAGRPMESRNPAALHGNPTHGHNQESGHQLAEMPGSS